MIGLSFLFSKEILSGVAIALTIYAYVLYIRSILAGKTKPHILSWLTFSITTLIVFFAQLADKGGLGAWPTGASAIMTMTVSILAYLKRSDCSITQADWLCLMTVFLSIPVWYATANPLWAVVLLTAMDAMGFIPTFRKTYLSPFQEHLTFYVLLGIRSFISILALEHFSLTTVLFPASISALCVMFVCMVIYRRNVITR